MAKVNCDMSTLCACYNSFRCTGCIHNNNMDDSGLVLKTDRYVNKNSWCK